MQPSTHVFPTSRGSAGSGSFIVPRDAIAPSVLSQERSSHALKQRLKDLWSMSPVNNAPVIDDIYYSPSLDPSLSPGRQLLRRAQMKLMYVAFMWYTVFWHIFRPTDLLGAAFTAFLVWACHGMGTYMDYNVGLVIGAIIFPISFAINNAHRTREVGLEHLADFKAACFSILTFCATWSALIPPGPGGGTDPEQFVKEAVQYVRDLQSDVRAYVDTKPPPDRIRHLSSFYSRCCALATHMQVLKEAGVPPPLLSKVACQALPVACDPGQRSVFLRFACTRPSSSAAQYFCGVCI